MFIGPIWGSGSIPWLNVLFSIPLLLIILSLVMFITSFKQLKPISSDTNEDTAQQSDTNENTEQQPVDDENIQEII